MALIFVYGTLKRGMWNNRLLGEHALYLGEAVTKDQYLMRDIGFPIIFTRDWPEQLGHVMGEVYDVTSDVVDNLDRLERHPDWYRRTPIVVNNLDTGARMDVEAYIYQREPVGEIIMPEDTILEWMPKAVL